ncbi:arginine deiminase type-3 [Colletotrichum sojae]|uniref:Arginine deiminase type-3 n=1 Tax=Colletotrichum sojae TaxID=2175907 RepID=A0A8H6IWE5_9PEZI|nr:arginine deiminase type-3 [Colletotrichum sojae]
MHLPTSPAAIALALRVGASFAQAPVILADTNRDGIISDLDAADKTSWTSSRGATFLPNVGDSAARCGTKDIPGNDLNNHELAACHDASGDVLFEPGLVAPLETLPLEVADDAYATIYASPDNAARRVRVFVNNYTNSTSGWKIFDPDFRFSAVSIRAGITLGIDGREFVTDASQWDGKVTVHFDVHSNDTVASDSVELKVAPVLVHHHLQPVDTLVSVAASDPDSAQATFLRDMDLGRQAAGLEKPILLFNGSSDIWAQDFIEPGYASMPGPDGPISIRIILRSAQPTRPAGRQVFGQLRGKGIGGYQPDSGKGGHGYWQINSYGNLETIPPYTSRNGTKYPVGRIIQGKHFDTLPAEPVDVFLKGQGLQTPLLLETGWLAIGHVDEFVQFLPSNKTSLGFTIAVADTTSAIDVLRSAAAAGHGSIPAVSFNASLLGNFSLATPKQLAETIDFVLANETFHRVNTYAQKQIDANLDILLSEVPLSKEDVIRVPVLFRELDFGGFGNGDMPLEDDVQNPFESVRGGEKVLGAFSPAAINGIVIGRHYLCPKPWGPVVEGVDLFEKALREVYAKAGMGISFVDDFLSHHVAGGEIHCGSNTLRETAVKWWE